MPMWVQAAGTACAKFPWQEGGDGLDLHSEDKMAVKE